MLEREADWSGDIDCRRCRSIIRCVLVHVHEHVHVLVRVHERVHVLVRVQQEILEVIPTLSAGGIIQHTCVAAAVYAYKVKLWPACACSCSILVQECHICFVGHTCFNNNNFRDNDTVRMPLHQCVQTVSHSFSYRLVPYSQT